MRTHPMSTKLLVALATLLLAPGAAPALDVYLRAEVTSVSLHCSLAVTCWGFARDTALGANDGVPKVPGPYLVVPPGDGTLRVTLTNNLPEPVSLVLDGQSLPTANGAPTAPVYHPAGPYAGRVRSFVHEAAPGGGQAVYLWTGLRPGTYLYSSGTHPGLQVQMGLFGPMAHDAAAGQAYPGVAYAAEALLVFHEMDTVLHAAVAAGQYGPGLAVTSPRSSRPDWYLINGKPNQGRIEALPGGGVGEPTLLRFVNAGAETHVPTVNGLRGTAVAEGGFPYTYAKDLAALNVAPQGTMDVVVTPTEARLHAVYDRRLFLGNTGEPGGRGMLKHLAFGGTYRPGDLDGDGTVGWSDYLLWSTDLGKAQCLGLASDFNGDGLVDWADFTLLAADFGRSSLTL